MMLRRDFLRRSTLALAGGLLVGDEALEAFARLTHQRRVFPGADLSQSLRAGPTILTDTELSDMLRRVYANYRVQMQNIVTPMLAQLEEHSRRPRSLYEEPRKTLEWGGSAIYFDVVKPRA